MNKVTIDNGGGLSLPHAAAREIGPQTLELVSHSGSHLLFTLPGSEDSVVFAGLLGELSVVDLLSFLNMFRKTGILHFRLAGGTKALYFQQGEIVFATSTFPEEDLGEVLFELGKVEREVLRKARQAATERTTIGKILVGKGIIGPKDLWLATRTQVETIVFNLFAFQQGSFSFRGRALENEEIVRLSMSTQNLIMEGLRRVDERALFLRRLHSFDAVPVLDGPLAEDLTASEERLILLVQKGNLSVRQVLRRSGLGEFDGLRLLYHMVERGLVRMEEAPAVSLDGNLGEILSVFNGALTILYRQVVGKNPEFGREVRCFLRDLPAPFSFVFRDVSLQENGSVDGGRILANLAGLAQEDQQKLLADALSEVVYMECMAARRELGAVESAGLIHRVQEVTHRVRNLIGRKA